MATIEKPIMKAEEIRRTLARISHEILERNHDVEQIYIIGIIRHGDILASRIVQKIKDIEGKDVAIGRMDVRLYRDDFHVDEEHHPRDLRNETEIYSSKSDKPVENMNVILVDDVLHKGRTARAAIDGLMDFGRPASIQLAVLIDRGPQHRDLPIQANYVGKNVPTSKDEEIQVHLRELDPEDSVSIVKSGE